MNKDEIYDRAKGALFGAFIGDAMGLGCHWYYDLDEMHKDCGDWIDTYIKPKKGRYHEHQNAGDLSQSGYILKLMLKSLIQNKGYSQKHFCDMLDKELFDKIDGTAMHGIGGYTSQSIRIVYQQRVIDGMEWSKVGSYADTTEAMERTFALGVFYAFKPKQLSRFIKENTYLTQKDEIVASIGVAYGALVGRLIQGDKLDSEISAKLIKMVKTGDLPFHMITSDDLKPPGQTVKEEAVSRLFSSPDALLTPSYMARAAEDAGVKIEPAWKVSLVYGMPCAIYHIVPACYYLASRFKDDFQNGLLHAINAGGQNQARAILTGVLIGAQVGFSNIPKHFIDGLREKDELFDLTDKICKMIEV